MRASNVLMLLIGLLALVGGFTLEGGHLGSLFEPTALLIVLGGTIGAVGLSFDFNDFKKIPKILKTIFVKDKKNEMYDKNYYINYFKELSRISKNDGKLTLENEISKAPTPLCAKGLSLFIDNMDRDVIENVLYSYADIEEEKYEVESAMFESAGGFGPTMGIIGTVMGLVHVLGNLEDPNSLGPKIAVAFIATLYGVGSANVLWLPLASKIKAINKNHIKNNLIIVEGILCLVEGVTNAELEERLNCIKEDEVQKDKKHFLAKKDDNPSLNDE